MVSGLSLVTQYHHLSTDLVKLFKPCMISALDHQQSYAGVLHSWRGGGAEKVHLLQDVVPRLQTPGVPPPGQGGVTLQQYS